MNNTFCSVLTMKLLDWLTQQRLKQLLKFWDEYDLRLNKVKKKALIDAAISKGPKIKEIIG